MNKLTLSSVTAAVALMLAGCVSLAPVHERPAAPVAAAWPAPTASTGTAAAALTWQHFYASDPRLRELIELALNNNRDLRVAVLNVEQARALARVADASRLPTVAAGFSSSRSPGANDAIVSSYQAGLQISAYELDLFGKIKNQSDAATARYLASAEGSRAAQISLVAGVASSYLALQADEELLGLTRQTLATREDGLRLTRLKFDAGAASQLDLSSAESAAASARATLAQAQRQRAQDENAVVLLVGQPLPGTLAAGLPLSAQSLPDVPAGLPPRSRSRSPWRSTRKRCKSLSARWPMRWPGAPHLAISPPRWLIRHGLKVSVCAWWIYATKMGPPTAWSCSTPSARHSLPSNRWCRFGWRSCSTACSFTRLWAVGWRIAEPCAFQVAMLGAFR